MDPESQRHTLLREAIDAAHDAIVITDRTGTIEWVNPAFCEMTGYPVSEALGKDPGTLLRSGVHDQQFYRDLWETVLAGRVWQGRIVNRRKDGTLYPEEQTITPVQGPSGAVTHFVAIKRDVSGRVEAEEKLRSANRALRVISGGNRALVRSTSEDALVKTMCRIAVDVGGYELAWIGYADVEDPDRLRVVAASGTGADELDGREVELSDGGGLGGSLATAIRTRNAVAARRTDAPASQPGPDGDAAPRLPGCQASMPLVSGGELLGALSVYATDPNAFDDDEMRVLSEVAEDLAYGITMHRVRRRTEELESQLRQAEKLRAVGQFAGGVAHDFNNYLTVITAVTAELSESSGVDDDSRAALGEIREAAERSAELTRQLLAFSRNAPARAETFDLSGSVRGMVSMLDRLLSKSIVVRLDLADEPLPVRADPGQLEQVLMNLAVNARDAMPRGGELSITTTRREVPHGMAGTARKPHAVLSVADSGVGMDEEMRERALEPFYTTKEGGTGLGLSTVYGIIKQSGGSLELESEPGRGTRFEILLPLRRVEELPASDAGTKATPRSVGGKETVVVVEDQDAVRRTVVRILQRFGYRTIECSSVAEARELSESPDLELDLLFTDLGLVDGDGRDVAAAFSRRRPGLRVLYASGYTPAAFDRPLSLGPSESFIEKPFGPDELARTVRSVLDTGGAAGGGSTADALRDRRIRPGA